MKIQNLTKEQAETIALEYARSFVHVIVLDEHGAVYFEIPEAMGFAPTKKNEKMFIEACKVVSNKLWDMILTNNGKEN